MNITTHSMVNQLLHDTAQAIIPSREEVDEQTAIANEVCIFFIFILVWCECATVLEKCIFLNFSKLILSVNYGLHLQIKLLLESRSRYGIPKTKIAGSIGKVTTILSSDVDLVIFINKSHLPGLDFDLVLKEFEDLLRNWSRYAVKNVRRTQYSVQFTVNNYDFDLLPAIDFVHEANIGPEQQIVLQQQRTLDKMKEDLHRNVYRYSSSLSFSTVNFMKKQPLCVHEMVRLAKFWYKSACVDEYVSGAKYVMELIATKVCHAVSTSFGTDVPYVTAFQKFLEDIVYFDSLDIIFEDEYRSLNEHKPRQNRVKPSVLDPANPYNNLAEAFISKPKAVKALKMHAERTLANIRGMQWDGKLNIFNFTFWRIIDIFKPDIFHCVNNVKMIIGSCTEGACKQYAPVEIRIGVNGDVRKHIEFMQMCLTAICKKAPGNNLMDRLELVYKMKYPGVNFIPAVNVRHEDYNATICLKMDSFGGIVFSFDMPA